MVVADFLLKTGKNCYLEKTKSFILEYIFDQKNFDWLSTAVFSPYLVKVTPV